MTGFEIHSQLLADNHRLGRFEVCHVLLHKNAAVPWFILVPEISSGDLLDLETRMRTAVLGEAAVIAQFIKIALGYPKINFAAIGNIVPQLHLHVVGRCPSDACWPAPVWGHLTETREYTLQQLEEISNRLGRGYGLCCPD
jgi:diadenosine tetraphosphate (Ap4A) HIT family hydrolase